MNKSNDTHMQVLFPKIEAIIEQEKNSEKLQSILDL